MNVIFGAMAPPLIEQLVGVQLQAQTVLAYQKDADAITRLAVRGLLPDGQVKLARLRLLRALRKEAKDCFVRAAMNTEPMAKPQD